MKKDLIEKIDISLEQNSDYREMTILTLQSAKEVLQIYMNLESDYVASQKTLDEEIASFRDRTQEVKDKIDEFYSSSSITLEQVKQAEELCEAIKEQILNYSKHIDEMQDKIEADKQEMQSIKNDTQELEKQTEENAKQSTNALNEIEKNKTELLEELKDTFNANLANLEEKISNYDKKIQETQQEIKNSKSEFETLATGAKTEISTLSTDSINAIKNSKEEIDTLVETSKTTLKTQFETSLEQLDNEASNIKTDISTQADDVKKNITAYINNSKEQIEQSLKPLSNLSSLDLSHYKFTDNGALFVSDDGVEKKFLLEGDIDNSNSSNQKFFLEEGAERRVPLDGHYEGEADKFDLITNLNPYGYPDLSYKENYSFLSPQLWKKQTPDSSFGIDFTNPDLQINFAEHDDDGNSMDYRMITMGYGRHPLGIYCSQSIYSLHNPGINIRYSKINHNYINIRDEGILIQSEEGYPPDYDTSNSPYPLSNSSINITPTKISIQSKSFTYNGREVLLK